MARYLEDRIETRRKDLADAIDELDEAAGRPKQPRTRKSSIQELARPPILDQVLGAPGSAQRAAGESSAMPQMSPIAASKVLEASAMPGPSPIVQAPPPSAIGVPTRDAEDVIPTRMREQRITAAHVAMMAIGAVVPMVVWGMVAWVALHRPAAPKAGASAPPTSSAKR
jgi:hypothetical protein